MGFEPVSGYSTNRTSTVFSDGSNEQRAEFVTTLSDGWTLESYSTDKSSAVITDGVNKQRAVVTYNLNGGAGGGSSSGTTTATNVSVNISGMDIIKTANVQAALKELDLAVKDLQDSVSILATSVELSNEFGQSTVVLLDELTSIEIDGRPSYKEPGATVYAENGSVGIISTLDTANGTANVVTISTFNASVAGDNGIKGDYSVTYGIISMPNGVITSPVDNNNLNIPAGIMLKAAGASTLTTLASASTHETISSNDFTLFYADGEFLECGEVYYSYKEPIENGVENYQAWFNPTIGKWQFRSNDTGNVWREAIATPLCDCIFTNGNITRIDFIGYRVLNKQEFATKDDIGNIEAVLDAINGEVL